MNKLLTIPETANALRVHRATVARLIGRGDLKATKIGSRRLVLAESVSALTEPERVG